MAVVALLATTIPSILLAVLDRRSSEQVPERWEPVTTLTELREREVVYDPRWGIFVVAEPQAPIALYAASPHDPNGAERVLFCPSSGRFEGVRDGETFDRRGAHASGPGDRGLDRFDVRVRDDAVEVNVRLLYRGAPAGAVSPLPATGPGCAERGYREQEPGFWGPTADGTA